MMKKKETKRGRGDLEYVTFGIVLIAVALGSMFSIELVRYSYWIFILSTLLLVHYVMNGIRLLQGSRLRGKSYAFGFGGISLLLLFLGIQSPQIPFKIWIFSAGMLILIWGFLRKKR